VVLFCNGPYPLEAGLANVPNLTPHDARRLKWDPAKEIFPDDAEANEYLDRKRRKPYTLPETI